MAFGQASGPPAPAKQVAELEALLAERGFSGFKEARHPFGLTQRQAGGKFTSAEAAELIDRLTAEAEVRAASEAPAPSRAARSTGVRRTAARAVTPANDRVGGRDLARQEEQVTTLDADVMATELTNRGWCCIPPD